MLNLLFYHVIMKYLLKHSKYILNPYDYEPIYL